MKHKRGPILTLCAATTADDMDREERKGATNAPAQEKAARGQRETSTALELRQRLRLNSGTPYATSAEGLSLAWMYRAYRR